MKRDADRFLLLPLLLVLSYCRAPTILVTIDRLPPGAASLQLMVASSAEGGAILQNTGEDPAPWNLPQPVPSQITVRLELPLRYSGQLIVSAAAFDKPVGTAGCILRLGYNAKGFMPSPLDDHIVVPLDDPPVMDTECSGQLPRLLAVTPSQGWTEGGTTTTVTGWGFRPGADVLIGGIRSSGVVYHSASELQTTVPRTPRTTTCGLTDLKVSNPNGGFANLPNAFRWIRRTLSFSARSVIMGDGARSVAYGLLDPDKQIDYVVTTNTTPQNMVTVFWATQLMTGRPPRFLFNDSWAPAVVSDMDRDGHPDIVTAGEKAGGVLVWPNDGTGWFSLKMPFTPKGLDNVAVAVGDLNQDGFPDVVAVNEIGKIVSIFLNDGTGALNNNPIQIQIKRTNNPNRVAIVHTTLDKYPDIVIQDRLSGSITQLVNTQGTSFPADDFSGLIHLLGGAGGPFAQGDLDGDGVDDLVVPTTSTNSIRIFLSSDRPNWGPRQRASCSSPRAVGIADFDCDGRADLAIGCDDPTKPQVQIRFQTSGNDFIERHTNSLPPDVVDILGLTVGDTSGDGQPDVIIANSRNIGFLENASQ